MHTNTPVIDLKRLTDRAARLSGFDQKPQGNRVHVCSCVWERSVFRRRSYPGTYLYVSENQKNWIVQINFIQQFFYVSIAMARDAA